MMTRSNLNVRVLCCNLCTCKHKTPTGTCGILFTSSTPLLLKVGTIACDCAATYWCTYILAVLRLGEVDEVVVVHVLSVEQVAVLPLAQVFGVDAVGPEELLVGDAEGLADGLSYELSLKERKTAH